MYYNIKEKYSQQNYFFSKIFDNDFAVVKLNNKWNLIDRNGDLVSKQWFDDCFNHNCLFVELNNKWNCIDANGELVSKQWFDDCDNFYNGFAAVELNGKTMYMDRYGNLHDKIQESFNTKSKRTPTNRTFRRK